MDRINELLTLYSTLKYVCFILAAAFLAVTIFFFFRFRMLNVIKQRLGIRMKMRADGSRNAPSTSQLSRSKRVAKMEYQSTELRGRQVPNSSKYLHSQSQCQTQPEVTAETELLRGGPFFCVVKEEMVIHTSEQL